MPCIQLGPAASLIDLPSDAGTGKANPVITHMVLRERRGELRKKAGSDRDSFG